MVNIRCFVYPLPFREGLGVGSFYYFIPIAWLAVIMTICTMSCTLQPRLRSLTGAAIPWRIGPTASAPEKRSTSL